MVRMAEEVKWDEWTYHVGLDWSEDLASQTLQPCSKFPRQRMRPGKAWKVVGQCVVGLSGEDTGLSNSSTERFFEPLASGDKRFGTDDSSVQGE